MEKIEAKDLRIGNNVLYPNRNDEREIVNAAFIITSINEKSCDLKFTYQGKLCVPTTVRGTGVSFDKIEPIHITEELLLDLGFEINKTPEVIEYPLIKMGFSFSIYRKIGFDIFFLSQYSEIDKGIMGTTQIKSVHQLQNLFFALTGKELTLKQK